MIDWLIKKLGGYTLNEYKIWYSDYADAMRILEDCHKTVAYLQALVPVSAVLPKRKPGRPKKETTISFIGSTGE